MRSKVKTILKDHADSIASLILDDELEAMLVDLAKECIACLNAGNKILFCGNGGSAADAQHIAAELSGKFYLNRKPLFAEALHVNSSYMTAVANDYGFEHSYARQIEAKGRNGDILIGLSTSGNSPNVLNAFNQAKDLGLRTVGWTGQAGGELAAISDLCFKMPSDDTPRIQEMHILIGHILCDLIESTLFGDKDQ